MLWCVVCLYYYTLARWNTGNKNMLNFTIGCTKHVRKTLKLYAHLNQTGRENPCIPNQPIKQAPTSFPV